jgi:predicted phage tail protein
MFGVYSDFTDYQTITSSRDLIPPATPEGFEALPGIGQVFVSWSRSIEEDLSYYEVFLNDTGLAPGADTPTNFQTGSNFASIPGLETGTLYYFWVRAVDTSGNRSSWSSVSTATALDLNLLAENLVGQITETQIADDAITSPKIAANAVLSNMIAANQIISEKIAANAVTSEKILVNELSALSADMGVVTAGVIQSDDGNFVINLNNKTILIRV